MSYSLTRFAIYETVRDMMGSSSKGPMPFYQKVLLGAFGGQSDHTHTMLFALWVNEATLVASYLCIDCVKRGVVTSLVALFCHCDNVSFGFSLFATIFGGPCSPSYRMQNNSIAGTLNTT